MIWLYILISSFLTPTLLHGRTVIDLQKYSTVSERMTPSGGTVKLMNLNRSIGHWYLLEIQWRHGGTVDTFHLENPFPSDQTIHLSDEVHGLVLEGERSISHCPLWDEKSKKNLLKGKKSRKPYVMLCEQRLLLRNQIKGQMTRKEMAVEFLRNNVWNGESLISFIKDTVYRDAEIIQSDYDVQGHSARNHVTNGPKEASLEKKFNSARLPLGELAISANIEKDGKLVAGKWYRSKKNDDIYVSSLQAQMVESGIRRSFLDRVAPLDRTESSAMVYLVAFDLSNMDIGYSLGTDHPEVIYSERTARWQKRKGWPGPDGIKDYKPLVSTGVLNPFHARKAVASFTGGFKRKHSVFRTGEKARRNHGTHYGFMQQGVTFSTLYEGLATALLTKEGRFELKTWTSEDTDREEHLVFARQNGYPLVYRDRQSQKTVPGPLVKHNFRGNWSGSKQNTIRALRTGLCLQTRNDRQFIIYGYFSSHTPNAMARVFQAYDCDYAMHLDMNMVVHTYLAVYSRDKGQKTKTEHLVKKMWWKDKEFNGVRLPRFVAVPDNRDFFYLIRRKRDLYSSRHPEID